MQTATQPVPPSFLIHTTFLPDPFNHIATTSTVVWHAAMSENTQRTQRPYTVIDVLGAKL